MQTERDQLLFSLIMFSKLPGLLPSQTPNTVKMRMNPRKNSNPNPCIGVTLSANVVCPKLLRNASSKSTFIEAVPATAPAHWKMIYSNARTRLILPVINMDTVTAGFICPPLTCPIACEFEERKSKNQIKITIDNKRRIITIFFI